ATPHPPTSSLFPYTPPSRPARRAQWHAVTEEAKAAQQTAEWVDYDKRGPRRHQDRRPVLAKLHKPAASDVRFAVSKLSQRSASAYRTVQENSGRASRTSGNAPDCRTGSQGRDSGIRRPTSLAFRQCAPRSDRDRIRAQRREWPTTGCYVADWHR